MGSALSKQLGLEPPPPQPQSRRFQHATISLIWCDTILISNGDDEMYNAVLSAARSVFGDSVTEPRYDSENWIIQLGHVAFVVGSSKSTAVGVKLVMCEVLQNLLRAGWRYVTAANLARFDEVARWYFVRDATPELAPDVCCIGLSSTDALHLCKIPKDLAEALEQEIGQAWTKGVQTPVKAIERDQLELQLHGNPWSSGGEEGVESRHLVLAAIKRMAAAGWLLYACACVKDTTDCIFFRRAPPGIPVHQMLADSFAISLNRADRLRIVMANDQTKRLVQDIVAKNYTISDVGTYGDALELELAGLPWYCKGEAARQSRKLMTQLLQQLRAAGWHLLERIDVSRSIKDKSTFLFVPGPPIDQQLLCLAPIGQRFLQLIGLSTTLASAIRVLIVQQFPPGILEEEQLGEGCVQLKLNKSPWYNSNPSSRHLAAVLVEFLRACGWQLVTAADVSGRYGSRKKGNSSEYFKKDPNTLWFTQQQPLQQQQPGDAPPPMYEEALKS